MSLLTAAERAFLEERRFPVLSTINSDGSSQQTVMWYALAGDTIVMNTKVGRKKERNMRRDPRVSLCFVEGSKYFTLSGTVTFDPDPDAGQQGIYDLAVRYDGEAQAAATRDATWSNEDRVSFTMTIDRKDNSLAD